MWRIELLGNLRIIQGEKVITRFESKKVAALVARLALAPERLHSSLPQTEGRATPRAHRNFKRGLAEQRRHLPAAAEGGQRELDPTLAE